METLVVFQYVYCFIGDLTNIISSSEAWEKRRGRISQVSPLSPAQNASCDDRDSGERGGPGRGEPLGTARRRRMDRAASGWSDLVDQAGGEPRGLR